MNPKISSSQITSLDEFGQRIYLNPAEVRGIYRKYRTLVQFILVIFFLILPWTKINNHQTLFLDIGNRTFYFFGFILKAHNTPLLLFIILGSALSLAYVTSVWGRIWCGWSCPQTVFIDGLFRRIEYFVEGDYIQRRKMKIEPMSFHFLFKKMAKWTLFYLASLFIAHSFLAYFVGSYRFIDIIQNGPNDHLKLFLLTQVFTLIFLFDFGWFREQFCTIMCPYGRIQGLLIDKNSLAVVYDEKRNDCIQCHRCVNACPIGIDIRNGLQMECIACTACIDACDEIMEKVNQPKGLIKYETINQEKINYFKPRSVLYLLGMLGCFFGLIYSLMSLRHSEVFILRSMTAPFILQKENGVDILSHQFRFHVHNQSDQPHTYKIEILNRPELSLVSQISDLKLNANESFDWHFFISGLKANFKSKDNIKIQISDSKNPNLFSQEFEITLLGPGL